MTMRVSTPRFRAMRLRAAAVVLVTMATAGCAEQAALVAMPLD
jgi:hypothetical protein